MTSDESADPQPNPLADLEPVEERSIHRFVKYEDAGEDSLDIPVRAHHPPASDKSLLDRIPPDPPPED